MYESINFNNAMLHLMLLHNVTHYTISLLLCIHINTTRSLNILSNFGVVSLLLKHHYMHKPSMHIYIYIYISTWPRDFFCLPVSVDHLCAQVIQTHWKFWTVVVSLRPRRTCSCNSIPGECNNHLTIWRTQVYGRIHMSPISAMWTSSLHFKSGECMFITLL